MDTSSGIPYLCNKGRTRKKQTAVFSSQKCQKKPDIFWWGIHQRASDGLVENWNVFPKSVFLETELSFRKARQTISASSPWRWMRCPAPDPHESDDHSLWNDGGIMNEQIHNCLQLISSKLGSSQKQHQTCRILYLIESFPPLPSFSYVLNVD